jgi:hypothetical protein
MGVYLEACFYCMTRQGSVALFSHTDATEGVHPCTKGLYPQGNSSTRGNEFHSRGILNTIESYPRVLQLY